LPSGWRHIEPSALLRCATSASSSATSGQTANSHLVICGAGATTCTKSVQRRRTLPPLQHAAAASCWREKTPIPPIIRAAGPRRGSCRRENHREHPKLQREECSQTVLLQVSPSQRRSEVARSNNSSHKHSKFQWQANPQQGSRVSRFLHSLNNQVSHFGLKM
jgi:hypothetical protein